MRTICKLFFLAWLSSAAWAAEPYIGAETLPGTWECYGPGQRSARTPPIVYFASLRTDEGGAATVFIDGFARTVNGRASLAAEANSLRLSTGEANLVLRNFSEQGPSARMMLDRDGVGSYQCYRLPRFGELAEEGPTLSIARPLKPRVYDPIQRTYSPEEVPGVN
jgi:hypothetical protein